MNYKLFDKKLLDDLKSKAYSLPRKRAHYNIHSSSKEAVQKVLICLLHNTYIPPHYHKHYYQTELFVVLKGTIKLIVFDKKGNITDVFLLGNEYDSSIIEILPNTIHTVICESKEAFILEIKQGPFLQNDCKEFPSWSILEDDKRSKPFFKNLKK